MFCEQPDGGKLSTAAKDIKDDYIFLQVQDRDFVAIEVRFSSQLPHKLYSVPTKEECSH